MIFVIILSSLALLAAIACTGLTLSERKRSKERNIALAQEIILRIEKLEKGVVPDFEKAKAATNAVNDFNAGITGILGYDPYLALQAQRDKDRGGEHI